MKKTIINFWLIPLLCCLFTIGVSADSVDSTFDTLAGTKLTLTGSIYNTNTKSRVTVSYGGQAQLLAKNTSYYADKVTKSITTTGYGPDTIHADVSVGKGYAIYQTHCYGNGTRPDGRQLTLVLDVYK